jgi:hypothetical protein
MCVAAACQFLSVFDYSGRPSFSLGGLPPNTNTLPITIRDQRVIVYLNRSRIMLHQSQFQDRHCTITRAETLG